MFIVILFILIILMSSLLSTIDFNNYLFIHALTYIFLAFSISFTLILMQNIITFWKKKEIKIKFNKIDFSLLLLGVYYIIRYSLSSSYNFLPDNILFLVILFISYYYIKTVFNVENDKPIILVLYALIVIGSVQAIYAILQYIGILPNLFDYKLGGSFGNPGDLANLLGLSYTISLGLFFYNTKRKVKAILFISIIVHWVVIVLSKSRTAWLAGTISSAIIFYYFSLSSSSIKSILHACNKHIIPTALVFIVIILSFGWDSYKLYCFKTSSANGRIFIWKLSTELIYERPVFGHGYDSFITNLSLNQMDHFKQHPGDFENGWLASNSVFAFNDYLQTAVEYGIVAVMIIFLILYRLFAFKNYTASPKKISLLFVSRVSIISVLISMLFSYPIQNPTIAFCIIILVASISSFDNNTIFSMIFRRNLILFFSVILFAFLGGLFFYSSQSISNGLKWKKANNDSKTKTDNYVSQYISLYNFLKHDRSFLLNYGSILYKSHNYEKCISHFEKYGYLCNTTDMYLMLGYSYEKTGNYLKAEESYKMASCLIPHLFVPKYRLFKLFKLTKQDDKANESALQISRMKIKVFSETVQDIKTEVNKYLLSENEAIKIDN
jgi:O-antigen polymerase